jgi:flavin-dependent dehydrogenase
MTRFRSNLYNTVICGAGPAGLMAAYQLGKLTGGAGRILLLDKKEPWKEPIFCAEAVSTHRLNELWPIDESWVRGRISGIFFTSPKGYKAEFYSKDCGRLLDRSKFHHALADACVDAGVECHFDALVKDISHDENGWHLNVLVGDEMVAISASAIIDATGPGCRLTRGIPCLEGIESGDGDLEPGIFAVAEGIEHQRDHIDLFYGSEFPGGYGWIFPRDGKEVNIGFVLAKDAKTGTPIREKLKQFIANHYPNASIKAIYGGMIACGQSNKPMAKCGLFKAGDAASCVNPLSRSGIVEALLCGKLVAESVHEWLNASDETSRARIEASVLDRWMAALGKSHLQIARAKPGLAKIKDEQFDKAAKRLSKLPREKQTLFRIFFAVLWSCPSVIWKMRSFLH